jgi:hypothetical protein
MLDPEYTELFRRFVRQNAEAEAWLRKAEAVRHYERRTDVQAAFSFGAVPAGFGTMPAYPPAIRSTWLSLQDWQDTSLISVHPEGAFQKWPIDTLRAFGLRRHNRSRCFR